MTQIFIDEENIEERYAQGLYEDYLKEKTEKLQSNWNSLREWLIKQREEYIPTDRYVDGTFDTIDEILDKRNELESSDNK